MKNVTIIPVFFVGFFSLLYSSDYIPNVDKLITEMIQKPSTNNNKDMFGMKKPDEIIVISNFLMDEQNKINNHISGDYEGYLGGEQKLQQLYDLFPSKIYDLNRKSDFQDKLNFLYELLNNSIQQIVKKWSSRFELDSCGYQFERAQEALKRDLHDIRSDLFRLRSQWESGAQKIKYFFEDMGDGIMHAFLEATEPSVEQVESFMRQIILDTLKVSEESLPSFIHVMRAYCNKNPSEKTRIKIQLSNKEKEEIYDQNYGLGLKKNSGGYHLVHEPSEDELDEILLEYIERRLPSVTLIGVKPRNYGKF